MFFWWVARITGSSTDPYWHIGSDGSSSSAISSGLGDLVFDVGANVGEPTFEYLELGASVVAIERLPQLADVSGDGTAVTSSRSRRAVSSASGTADLDVPRYDGLSSFSRTVRHPSGDAWRRRVPVRVVTLDSLSSNTGFLASSRLTSRATSWRLTRAFSTRGRAIVRRDRRHRPGAKCVNRLSRLGGYEFNFAVGNEYKLRLPESTPAAQVVEAPKLHETTSGHRGRVRWRGLRPGGDRGRRLRADCRG